MELFHGNIPKEKKVFHTFLIGPKPSTRATLARDFSYTKILSFRNTGVEALMGTAADMAGNRDLMGERRLVAAAAAGPDGAV